jgi:hypothetical protein
METVQEKGLTPVQKKMLFQMFLVMAVGWTVSSLLHQPRLMVTFLILGWTLAVLVHARVAIGYWNIVRSVLTMGALMYVIHRFIMPWASR